jgi:hypothetical protein
MSGNRLEGYLNLVNGASRQAVALRRIAALVSLCALSAALIATARSNGLAMYSPDSWAYFELAKTVFSGEFYEFSTYRSYISDVYSASFPLGYPVLLAVGQQLFGAEPLIAVWLNVAIATATWLLVMRLASQMAISPLAGFVLAWSLVLWGPYLDEVFSGRSIPAALFMFLLACSAWFSRRLFVCGLLLGYSALIRFDYLVFALLFQIAVFWFALKIHGRSLCRLVLGFLLGLAPWMVYSLTHFGKFWVSDNSWVALSATPAFVLDFPAVAAVTAFDDPIAWIARLVSNIAPLVGSITSAAQSFPILLVVGVAFVVVFRDMERSARQRSLIQVSILFLSVLPYLLTGYFNDRYFALLLLSTAGVFLYSVELAPPRRDRTLLFHGAVLAAWALCLVNGGRYLTEKSSWGLPDGVAAERFSRQIGILDRCHAATPQVTYIFTGSARRLAPQYGALTGRRAAYSPSNFARMTTAEKSAYFDRMKPFILIDRMPEQGACFHE